MDFLTIINNLENKNCVSFDNINMKIIKIIASHITSPQFEIFNFSLKKVVFPKNFKIAKVVIISKSSDKNNLVE